MSASEKVIFIGSTRRGYLALKAMVDAGFHVVGIVNLKQAPHEHENYEEAIQELAGRLKIPHRSTNHFKNDEILEWLCHEVKSDVAVIVGCRVMIPASVYRKPRLGSFAVHDSLLPAYRGFAPLNWSIMNDADHVGVSLFRLNEDMDGGDVVNQIKVPIAPDDRAREVYDKVCAATVGVLLESLPALCRGEAKMLKQDNQKASYTCSRKPEDGLIDWSSATRDIHNLVRGLGHPYPGAFTFVKTEKITIWETSIPADQPHYEGRIPGRVVSVCKESGCVDVLTGDGVLRVHAVQKGQTEAKAADIITSVRSSLGFRVTDWVARIEALEKQVSDLKMMSHGALQK
jgi:methionyl-tRNA formyltransferase